MVDCDGTATVVGVVLSSQLMYNWLGAILVTLRPSFFTNFFMTYVAALFASYNGRFGSHTGTVYIQKKVFVSLPLPLA